MAIIRPTFITLEDDVLAIACGDDYWDTPAHKALCGWLQDHGIDPRDVPSEATIRRGDRAIEYPRFLRDTEGRMTLENGTVRVDQWVQVLQAPPKPWPDAVVELAELSRS